MGESPMALRAGTRARPGGHEGVLRRGRLVLYGCGHEHPNRESPGRAGAALPCLVATLRAARDEHLAEQLRAQMRTATEHAAQMMISRTGRAEMLERGQADLRAFDAQLATLAALLGDEPVFGHAGTVVLAPTAPRRPCPACGAELVATCWRPAVAEGAGPGHAGEGAAAGRWSDWRPAGWLRLSVPPRCVGGATVHATPEPLDTGV